MATKVKNYNISPYFDDFDESKGYQRILFKVTYTAKLLKK